MKIQLLGLAAFLVLATTACKKEGCTDPAANNYSDEAKKDDGTCLYDAPAYTVPATYAFTNSSSATTVDFAGQLDRLKQLKEIITYAKLGRTQIISAQVLRDMFANEGGNGNGNFTFTSSYQLKDNCLSTDVAAIETLFDQTAAASTSFAVTAASGVAGVSTSTTSSTSKYLLDANGRDMAEMIEKHIMRSVFMHQALNVYLGSAGMNADNTIPVSGQTYTAMAHNWDQAFGCFGVPVDFPANTDPAQLFYWGKYTSGQDAALNPGVSAYMMNNFLTGRAALSANKLADRDAAVNNIKVMWEKIAAIQAMKYIGDAITNFGDDAKRLHALGEGYGLVQSLRYAPAETAKMTSAEIDALTAMFGTNMWDLTVNDLNNIKAAIDAKY